MDQEPKPSRREFLKSLPILGAAVIGVGEAPFQIVKGELEGNKKREGNSVTVTLDNGKKVSLVYGFHTENFEEGQTVPSSDILAIESINDFETVFKNIPNVKEVEVDEIIGTNSTPILREMARLDKPLYHCDLANKQEETPALNFSINPQTGYTVLSLLFLANSRLMASSRLKRRDFLNKTFSGLSLGLSARSMANWKSGFTSEDGLIAKPDFITAKRQLMKKFKDLDDNSMLGKIIENISEGEELEGRQIFELVRSIIMALKLKSALRISEKQSITMTVGAGHILVEDFLTMSDADLIKKLIPFKEGFNRYFDIRALHTMTYAFYDSEGKLHIEKKDDTILKELVEKYLE